MSEQVHTNPSLTATTTRICVVGLGYVGLPLAQAFDSAGHEVWGFDIDPEKIETLEAGVDPTGDVGDEAIATSAIEFTTDPRHVEDAEVVIVAVPTPVDELEKPDLSLIERAGQMIGDHLTPGTTVVLESTVYPGATREVFIPALESASGLEAGSEIGVGYSLSGWSPAMTSTGSGTSSRS